MDEQKHVRAARKWKRPKNTTFRKYKKWPKEHDENESVLKDRSSQTKSSQLSDN
jgi:hypothetical protein